MMEIPPYHELFLDRREARNSSWEDEQSANPRESYARIGCNAKLSAKIRGLGWDDPLEFQKIDPLGCIFKQPTLIEEAQENLLEMLSSKLCGVFFYFLLQASAYFLWIIDAPLHSLRWLDVHSVRILSLRLGCGAWPCSRTE